MIRLLSNLILSVSVVSIFFGNHRHTTKDVLFIKKEPTLKYENQDPLSKETCSKAKKVAFKIANGNSIRQKSITETCEICQKRYTDKEKCIKHILTHFNQKPFKCGNCDRCFSSENVLKTHVIRVHDLHEKTFDCDFCELKLKSKSSLAVHRKRHLKKYVAECKYCKIGFARNQEYINHMGSKHGNGDKPFECDFCGLKLKSKGSLTIHRKRHLKEYVAECEYCKVGFVTNQEYINHMGSKHGPSNHVCNICGRSCYDKAALQGHMARHAKDYGTNPNIRCDICNKTFLQEKYLKHHFLRMHENGGQRFICDLCGKKVNSKRSLRDHMYIHQGIKPLECKECGKSFGLRTTLKLHMRTHTGQRPYECTICGKCFTQRTPLTVHMRYHTGERPYSCHLCDSKFVSGGLLNLHVRKVHGTNT